MGLLSDRNVIKSEWIFDIQRHGRGKKEHFMGRLVAKEFSQSPERDFEEGSLSISQYAAVHSMVSLAILFQWKDVLVVVNNTWVNAPLKEEIYVAQPEVLVKKEEDIVFHFKEALYQLYQASLKWNVHLLNFLQSFNYKQAAVDPTITSGRASGDL